mgnify:CR=1 FL=1
MSELQGNYNGPDGTPVKPILKAWVAKLGLRHQGLLLTAVRGCDTATKHDPSKALVRCYRATVLNAHCGDPRKTATFIEVVDHAELLKRMEAFRTNCDHYPNHYIMHFVHAVAVVGYKAPREEQSDLWLPFYRLMCSSMHFNPETEEQMDRRLDAPEIDFAQQDRLCELEMCPKVR